MVECVKKIGMKVSILIQRVKQIMIIFIPLLFIYNISGYCDAIDDEAYRAKLEEYYQKQEQYKDFLEKTSRPITIATGSTKFYDVILREMVEIAPENFEKWSRQAKVDIHINASRIEGELNREAQKSVVELIDFRNKKEAIFQASKIAAGVNKDLLSDYEQLLHIQEDGLRNIPKKKIASKTEFIETHIYSASGFKKALAVADKGATYIDWLQVLYSADGLISSVFDGTYTPAKRDVLLADFTKATLWYIGLASAVNKLSGLDTLIAEKYEIVRQVIDGYDYQLQKKEREIQQKGENLIELQPSDYANYSNQMKQLLTNITKDKNDTKILMMWCVIPTVIEGRNSENIALIDKFKRTFSETRDIADNPHNYILAWYTRGLETQYQKKMLDVSLQYKILQELSEINNSLTELTISMVSKYGNIITARTRLINAINVYTTHVRLSIYTGSINSSLLDEFGRIWTMYSELSANDKIYVIKYICGLIPK